MKASQLIRNKIILSVSVFSLGLMAIPGITSAQNTNRPNNGSSMQPTTTPKKPTNTNTTQPTTTNKKPTNTNTMQRNTTPSGSMQHNDNMHNNSGSMQHNNMQHEGSTMKK